MISLVSCPCYSKLNNVFEVEEHEHLSRFCSICHTTLSDCEGSLMSVQVFFTFVLIIINGNNQRECRVWFIYLGQVDH